MNTNQDGAKDLVERLKKMTKEDFRGESDIWKPERPDEMLIGTIKEMKTVSGKFGKQLLVTVETADGDKLFYCNKNPANQILRQKARVGDYIAARYFGKEALANGNFEKKFGILVKPRAAEIADVDFI